MFQTLPHTLALDNAKWRVLDRAHTLRNLAEYEGALDIDASLVDALVRVAGVVRDRVVAPGPRRAG